MGVLQVGRGVPFEGQHAVPIEDVIFVPVTRQVRVLDGADPDRPGDARLCFRVERWVLLRYNRRGAGDGFRQQVDQTNGLSASRAKYLLVRAQH